MQVEFGDLAAKINIARHHFIQEGLKPLGEYILNPAKSAAPKTKPVLREIMTHPRFI